MSKPKKRPPVNIHSFFGDRSKCELPREKLEDMPFVFYEGRLIAPWPRHALWPDEEAKLCAVVDQVAQYGAALRVPVWLWPDGRAPVPVNAADPNWLQRWAEGRASYVSRSRAA